ncbi:MAG: methionyl-tRNA formyltransferase [Candidatus Nanopelagicales bacterium]
MKILFIGSVKFSLSALKLLLELNSNIVGICTLKNSNINTDRVDLSNISKAHKIPWIYANDINSQESITWIKSREPDIIFCFGWSRILKKELLDLPSLGAIGYHPTLLPANRGRHPIIWALSLGLNRTGSTFFVMNEGVDSGDLISQRVVPIEVEENAGSLYEKLIKVALDQIREFLPMLKNGNIPIIKQNDLQSNTWRKRSDKDGRIDWRMSARTIHNLVKAITKPYPGAYFEYENERIIVWKSTVIPGINENIEPGKILSTSKNGPVVKCGEESIKLLLTEPNFRPKVGWYL